MLQAQAVVYIPHDFAAVFVNRYQVAVSAVAQVSVSQVENIIIVIGRIDVVRIKIAGPVILVHMQVIQIREIGAVPADGYIQVTVVIDVLKFNRFGSLLGHTIDLVLGDNILPVP